MLNIGFIGLGVMGTAMAQRLLHAGYRLIVFNRTAGKVEELIRQGANAAASPIALAKESDVVISMVSDSRSLEEISQGSNGIIHGIKRGAIHIDMSTVSPSLTERLYSEYKSANASFLHAPVLGSKPQASDGTLLIFVGGDMDAYGKCENIFKVLGKKIWHFPHVETASYLKLIMNSMIASMMTTLSGAIVFGEKAGISVDVVLEVLENSALNSPMYQGKGKMIRERSFQHANFYLDHLLKDINLILEASERLNVPMPALASLRELFVFARSRGYGQEDYSAVVKVLEEMAGMENQKSNSNPS
jgi:3-hydroxyisobutyrate dehydrogenase